MANKPIVSFGEVKTARSPTLVDVRIGQLIRERRTERGLTLDELSSKLGIAPHQLQKYETGSNRVPASRLVDCARSLEVSVTWFYNEAATGASLVTTSADPDEEALLQHFRRLDVKGRTQLLNIARVLDVTTVENGTARDSLLTSPAL